MATVTFLAAVFLVGAPTGISEILRKSLAGPPDQFSDFVPPNARDSADVSYSFGLPVTYLSKTSPKLEYKMPVDETEALSITIVYQDNSGATFQLNAKDPNGELATPSLSVKEEFGINTGDMFPSHSIAFESPLIGEWTIELELTSADTSEPFPIYTFATFVNSAYKVWAALKYENLRVGQDITLQALVPAPKSLNNSQPVPALNSVKDAMLTLTLPDGKEMRKHMEDEENDGVYEGVFRATEAGIFNARIDISGFTSSQHPFVRTLWYQFSVAEPTLNITKEAVAYAIMTHHDIMDTDIIHINVPVIWDQKASASYRGFTQVWGTSLSNEFVPVAWLSGILDITDEKIDGVNSSKHFLQFDLDSCWLDKAKAGLPLMLKDTNFDELRGYVTLASVDTLKVVTSDPKLLQRKSNPSQCNSYNMKNGYNPYRYGKVNTTEGGKLVLVHGYCAQETPFSLDQFTDYAIFEDFNQNRLTDEFAEKIAQFAKDFSTFSLYSHSQGGIAGLHMASYYQTGLDLEREGYQLQSIGTPYHGTDIAGLLADIGAVLGLLCGSNSDLTPDAAERWLSEIPREVEEDLHYYVTQYKDAGLFGSYCIWGAGAVLGHPNDGLVSISKTDVKYATREEYYVGECHSVGMHYPPQCKDSERNAKVNKLAGH